MLARSTLDELLDYDGVPGRKVISLYLDVDGARFPGRTEYEAELKSLLRRAAHYIEDSVTDREEAALLSAELEEIRRFISIDFRRNGARGLALFSCRSEDFWRVLPLGVPPANVIFVDTLPRVAPLAELIGRHRNLCVLVTNKERARVFRTFAGDIEEYSQVLDKVPGHHDQGGWEQSKLQRWHDLEVRGHLKRAADAVLDLFKRERFDGLVLGVPEELAPELNRVLHPYLRERIVGRFTIDANAAEREILAQVSELEESLQQRGRETLLASLAAELAAGRNAAGGLDDVLTALNQRRVGELIVAAGFSRPGRRCTTCGTLSATREECPTCGQQTEAAEDIVAEARESAVRQAAVVFRVDPRHAAIGEAGGIAARLRY